MSKLSENFHVPTANAVPLRLYGLLDGHYVIVRQTYVEGIFFRFISHIFVTWHGIDFFKRNRK